MFELRFGSYSMAATLAGTPTLSRRKSTWRYCFLCPPPRCQITISPWLLRPPERCFGSSRAFSGSCLVIWLLSRTVINRRDAVYGLKLLSAIAASYLLCLDRGLTAATQALLQILRVLDHLFAFRQLHVGFLPIATIAFVLTAAAHLAVKIGGAHIIDLHFEDLLHRFLDLRLGRARRDFKDDRVLRLFHAQALFGDDRPANNLIRRGGHCLFLPLLAGGFLRPYLFFFRRRFR